MPNRTVRRALAQAATTVVNVPTSMAVTTAGTGDNVTFCYNYRAPAATAAPETTEMFAAA